MTATAPKNRRNRKAQDMAEATELKDILNQEPEKTVTEAAEYVGTTEAQLLEMFCERLSDGSVLAWHTVPIEHDPLLDEFKNLIAAENSVRPFEYPTEPAAQLPPVVENIPELPEEPQPKKSKRKSSALTEKKSEAINQTRQAATQTNAGISETLTLLQAQQGLIDSSQAGTAYLTTYTANLTNVKGEGLTVIAAQMLQEISQKSGFDPQEILKQVGVPLTPETQQKLQDTMGQVLGKAQAASTEIQQTSWGNGYDLQAELGHLTNLMNCTD
jgi:hypothetical protein